MNALDKIQSLYDRECEKTAILRDALRLISLATLENNCGEYALAVDKLASIKATATAALRDSQ